MRIILKFVVGLLLVAAECLPASAQGMKLELSIPKNRLKLDEPLNLSVVLRNQSDDSFYVKGTIAFEPATAYGNYSPAISNRRSRSQIPSNPSSPHR